MWHNLTVDEVKAKLNTDITKGLTNEEAAARLEKNGANALSEGKKKNLFLKFLEQFKDFMIIILLIAAALSVITEKEWTDATIILIIVIVNAIIGLVQESRAEKALEALKKMSAPLAKVLRDKTVLTIEASLLVQGDVIILEAGDFVPADARLIEAVNIKSEESALTGESLPVEKTASAVEGEVPLGDRINMVFSTSSITNGRARAIVVETGMNTEVGKIADLLMSGKEEKTPLQKELNKVGKLIGIGVLIICAIIFGVSVLRPNHENILELFSTAVGLAVAAIPEGLPAIVTIVLAMGVSRMVARGAIVKKLPAVETLGSASVICSDKTGTLTQNKMTVVNVFAMAKNESLTLEYGSLCNDTRLIVEGGNVEVQGDPTETAIVSKAYAEGKNKNVLDENSPRVLEIPFDSTRKLMTTVHKVEGGYVSITKGAPDILIELSHTVSDDGEKPIKDYKDKLINANDEMAGKALRVLGVAYKKLTSLPENIEELETQLTFLGLIGMIDPPRPEVIDAVRKCSEAGIRPVMITGDHKITAIAIAKEIKIFRDGDLAITGADLDKISDADLDRDIEKYSVFARVSPENKVRIVQAWQAKGQIVAMTGDGVNDAPALKTAEIGCAMGITGTDVSKGAADMILTDDNFATIVKAVEEGRGIFSNIKKAINFLLSSNIGEVLTVFTATMIGLASPFVAKQLLWVNLVTDSFPALALGVEPVEKGIMQQKPRNAKKSIFSGRLLVDIIWQGVMIGALALSAYLIGLYVFDRAGSGHIHASTMAFAVLAFSQLFHAFNIRSTESIFKMGILSNKSMVWAFIISAALQFVVMLVPPIQKVFEVAPLSAKEWLIVAILSITPVIICEIVKLFRRMGK